MAEPPGSSLERLAEGFRRLVTHLAGEDGDQMRLQTVTDHIRDLIPSAHHVDLVDTADGVLRTHGHADDVALAVTRICQETASGPLHEALETNDVIVCGDVPAETRWRAWARRVTEETSVQSVVAFRIHLNRSHRGALSLYSPWPHAFDDDDIALGSILASYCSLMMLTELYMSEPVGPRRAADVHREIGGALAILLGVEAQRDGDPDPRETPGDRAAHRLSRAAEQVVRRLDVDPAG